MTDVHEPAFEVLRDVHPTDVAPVALNGNGNGNGQHSNQTDEGPQAPEGLALTDMGNAARFVRDHGNDVLYCDPQETFYVWDGGRWTPDVTQDRVRRAKDTVTGIWDEVRSAPSRERAGDLAKHALKSQASERLSAMLRLSQSELPVRSEEFDTDHYLLNFSNGTMDLRTFTFRDHRRRDKITKRVRAPYDPDATCPQFETFLRRIMADNEAMIAYLQRFFGYCLTGLTTERMLSFWYGLGGNGKSVLSETIQDVLEDYATVTQSETLMRRERKDLSNDVAALVGARIVVANETEDGSRVAESLVKQLTGGDKVSARHLYADFFTFRPTFKLIMIGNYMPVVRGSDPAIWDRFHLVPFSETIPPHERDPHLRAKLVEEAAGILNWMIEGCRQWQERGRLDPPDDVVNATKEYRDEMDILGHFFLARCVMKPGTVATAQDLYDAYTEWCDHAGEHPMTQARFGSALPRRGFRKRREVVGGVRIIRWHGIGLQADPSRIAATADTTDTDSPESTRKESLRDFWENHGNRGSCGSDLTITTENEEEERNKEEGGQLF